MKTILKCLILLAAISVLSACSCGCTPNPDREDEASASQMSRTELILCDMD